MRIILVDNGYSSDNLFILENGIYYEDEEIVELVCMPHTERHKVHRVDKSRLGRVGMMLARDEIDDPVEWLKAFEMVYNNEEVDF